MPNGKPGDHPYTDIVIHNWEVFGEEIDGLVRELHHMPGFALFREKIAALLFENKPKWSENADLDLVKRRLCEIKSELKKKVDMSADDNDAE